MIKSPLMAKRGDLKVNYKEMSLLIASLSLYVLMFSFFMNLDVNVPDKIEPFTFNAVRPISINGSTVISKPASATGKFIDDNTISAANVAPPPTPATPNELIPMIKIKGNKKPGDNGSIP